MRVGSLFTGYGGFELALSHLHSIEWVSDIAPGPVALLKHRMPQTPNLGDVTQVNWAEIPDVDVIVGGSPCQDLSFAGTRLGMHEGTKSGLWESMLRAIKEKQPKLVVWENVLGALSAEAFCDLGWVQGCVDERSEHQKTKTEDRPIRALGRVLGDLANLGYDARWRVVRASDVGAVHARARVFVAAYPRRFGLPKSELARSFEPAESSADNHSRTFPYPEIFGNLTNTVIRWENVLGRPAPYPEVLAPDGEPRLRTRFVEWMMGLPDGWVTDIGLPYSREIEMLGNGVVPQQAAYAIKSLLDWEINE